MEYIDNRAAIKEICLEKEEICCAQIVDIEVSPELVANELLYKLRAFVLSENLNYIHRETSYPSDWWQAFKLRWFPQFMLKKWPVGMTKYEVNIDIKAFYPELTTRISLPKEDYVVKYYVSENLWS